MDIYQSLVLGIIQGLTELLPISSSAHLFLVPWFLNWNNILDSFDIALHFGTLLAIGLFFFKDWILLIKGGYEYTFKKKKTREGKMFWYLVLATIPGGGIGFILDKYAEAILTQPVIIAIALIAMGITLYLVDKFSKKETDYEELTLKQTFIIGLSQSLAFIPGVSRSGITMTTGRALGVKREAVAKYSFMLAAPIVLGATIYKLKEFIFDIPFLVGVVTSFLVGLIVIKFLLNYLKKGSFKAFAYYRVILGIIVIAKILL